MEEEWAAVVERNQQTSRMNKKEINSWIDWMNCEWGWLVVEGAEGYRPEAHLPQPNSTPWINKFISFHWLCLLLVVDEREEEIKLIDWKTKGSEGGVKLVECFGGWSEKHITIHPVIWKTLFFNEGSSQRQAIPTLHSAKRKLKLSFFFVNEMKQEKSIITVRLLQRKFNQTRRKLMKLIFGAVIEWSESNGGPNQFLLFHQLILWEWMSWLRRDWNWRECRQERERQRAKQWPANKQSEVGGLWAAAPLPRMNAAPLNSIQFLFAILAFSSSFEREDERRVSFVFFFFSSINYEWNE